MSPRKLPLYRVLVIDNEVDATLFSEALAGIEVYRRRVEVDTANNGRRAYDMVIKAMKKRRPYNVITTEMQMPNGDGKEFIHRIEEAGSATPVIVVTKHADDDLTTSLVPNSTVKAVLKKPIYIGDYLQAVREVLDGTLA